MRLSRNSSRSNGNIWPGYVDAVTTLLMVIMFALTIAMVVQAVLRERISTQDSELDRLGDQISQISSALSASQALSDDLGRDLGAARSEIDAQAEAARLAAARREALEALIEELRQKNTATENQLTQAQTRISEAEAQRLADAAAAEALRQRLQGSQAELTAMTLQLEAARKEAGDTLTLLAAAEAAKSDLEGQITQQVTEAQKQAALLALAQQKVEAQDSQSGEEQRRIAALGQQVAQLSAQLGNLQAVLSVTGEDQKTAQLEIENLGAKLNAALVRAAEEERKRRALEQAAREKAEAEAADLTRYRSEFFGRLSQILEGQQGVQVVGDRFVFSSEVLFSTGEATLSSEGDAQIRDVTQMLDRIATDIPPEIDWIIRVDGHTDNQPLSGTGRYRDNWELSQARALAVVRYMVDDLGFPRNRVAATGFGDTRPIAPNDTPDGRAQNRRIELKLTER